MPPTQDRICEIRSTDPETAPADSLRGLIFAKKEELDVAVVNVGMNGVHASASRFEALAEFGDQCGQLEQLLADSLQSVGGQIGQILVKQGDLDEPTLQQALARQAGMEMTDLSSVEFTEDLLRELRSLGIR